MVSLLPSTMENVFQSCALHVYMHTDLDEILSVEIIWAKKKGFPRFGSPLSTERYRDRNER